jgi:hypothetical protein
MLGGARDLWGGCVVASSRDVDTLCGWMREENARPKRRHFWKHVPKGSGDARFQVFLVVTARDYVVETDGVVMPAWR